jgi:hypothetical protein
MKKEKLSLNNRIQFQTEAVCYHMGPDGSKIQFSTWDVDGTILNPLANVSEFLEELKKPENKFFPKDLDLNILSYGAETHRDDRQVYFLVDKNGVTHFEVHYLYVMLDVGTA